MAAIEIKAIAYLVAFLAIVGGLFAARQHERHIGAQQCEAQVSSQHARDVAKADADTARITADREASSHEADKFRVQALTDRAASPAAGERLQQSASALLGRCLSAGPGLASNSQAAASAADLSAELRSRIESARRDIRSVAGFATAAYAASVECAGAYPVK